MDYLDPNKKRAHKIRLMFGYSLFAIAIGFATMLLVYMGRGYYRDPSTGEVIQNSLVFVNSKPGGASVYLNGEQQRGKTDMRLVIPGDKNYDVDIKKDGYRDWTRSILLEGGSLRELTYARLIPTELSTSSEINLRAEPVSSSQSINKRWLVLSYAESPLAPTLVDLSSRSLNQEVMELPASLVAKPTEGKFEVEEWSEDDRFFLASYTVGGAVNYLLVDRENPEQAQNLNTLFGNKNFEISLQDRKRDKFFVFDKDKKLLFTANLSSGISKTPMIDKKLLAYETFGTDWVTYLIESGKEGLVQARFMRGNQDIALKDIKTADKYFIELAKLENYPVMAISSSNEDRATVYQDPQKYLNDNPTVSIPVATTVLRVKSIQDLTISADSSIVLAYGPENMASHEFEIDRSYNFILDTALDDGQEVRWMDGQHLTFSSGGVQYVVDFDGNNNYDLVKSITALGSFYTEDIKTMFTFLPAVQDPVGAIIKAPQLISTSLVMPADL